MTEVLFLLRIYKEEDTTGQERSNRMNPDDWVTASLSRQTSCIVVYCLTSRQQKTSRQVDSSLLLDQPPFDLTRLQQVDADLSFGRLLILNFCKLRQ